MTEWDPPHKVAYVENEWEPGAPPVATEITITSRSGDQCLVRMVHTLFTSSDDWDDQIEGFEKGWPGFFAVLRMYLAHFAGANAASFMAMTPSSMDSLSAWTRLCDALDLAGANVGERRTASSGPEPWSGIVERVYQDAQQRYVLLRIDDPSPGIALIGTLDVTADRGDIQIKIGEKAGANVSLCWYYYGENAATFAEEKDPRWRDWLANTFGDDGADDDATLGGIV